MRKLITILTILLVSTICYATEYYVSPTGSNANNGLSTGAPFLTINYAVTQVSSGDRINLMDGVHAVTGMVDIPVGVDINGLDSSGHLITGTVTTFQEGIFRLQSTEGTNGNQDLTNLNFYGGDLSTTASAVVVYGRSNVSISYCRFVNFNYSAVLVAAQNTFYPNNVAPTTYATGIYFGYNYTYNSGGFYTFGYAAFWAHGTEGLIIEHNSMNQTSRPDGENGWLIKLLDFHRGTKIRYNNLVKAPFPYSQEGENGYFGFAIESADNVGMEIAYNTIKGSIDINRQERSDYAYSAYIHHNTIGEDSTPAHTEFGVILEYDSYDVIIDSNVIFNVNNPIFFSFHDAATTDSVSNILIAGNELRNIGSSQGGGGFGEFISFYSNDDDDWSGDSIFIYNNSMTANPTYTIPWGISFSHTSAANHIRIKNNIATNVSGGWIVSGVSNLLTDVEVTNNCTYNNGYSNAPAWLAGNPSSYTYSDNLVGTNPLFISTTDLHLQSSSPCIGAAVNLGYGADIGAYQYGDVAPVVLSTTPTSGATGVSIAVTPTGTFSEALNPATVTTTNVTMTQGVTPVTISVSYLSNVITVTPSSPLSYSTTYTVNFGTGITDAGGLPLATTYSWSFTTTASTPPTPTTYYKGLFRWIGN